MSIVDDAIDNLLILLMNYEFAMYRFDTRLAAPESGPDGGMVFAQYRCLAM
jgi:hypothetical protein